MWTNRLHGIDRPTRGRARFCARTLPRGPANRKSRHRRCGEALLTDRLIEKRRSGTPFTKRVAGPPAVGPVDGSSGNYLGHEVSWGTPSYRRRPKDVRCENIPIHAMTDLAASFEAWVIPMLGAKLFLSTGYFLLFDGTAGCPFRRGDYSSRSEPKAQRRRLHFPLVLGVRSYVWFFDELVYFLRILRRSGYVAGSPGEGKSV